MKAAAVKKQLFALAALGAGLLLFQRLKNNRAAMDALVSATSVYKRAVGALCAFVPFSVGEVLYAAAVAGACVWLVRAVIKIARQPRGQKAGLAVKKLLSLLLAGLSVYAMFTVLWGANYYATPFEETAGIQRHDISVEQLQQVTALFAQKVNQTALQVHRDKNGIFAEDQSVLFSQSKNLYTPLEQRYPALAAPHRAAKPMAFSYLMSVINYTGFFFPFTGEANLNVEAPACLLPATIAHELAHVRNIAPEQTANFVAVLACEASGIPAYTYSGALLAYLHLSNALYGADRARWAQVEQTLCRQARADLNANNAYWRQFEGAAATAANTVYEGFLHSYDQTLGLKSYGAVVDLLVAYYGIA